MKRYKEIKNVKIVTTILREYLYDGYNPFFCK